MNEPGKTITVRYFASIREAVGSGGSVFENLEPREITDEEVGACFQEAWKRLPVGATIPAGVRHRCEYTESGDAREATRLTHRLVPGEDAYFVRASDWGQVILPEPEPDPTEVMDEAIARELCADAVSRASDLGLGGVKGFDDIEAGARGYWLSEARRLREVQDRAGYTVEPKPREEGAS